MCARCCLDLWVRAAERSSVSVTCIVALGVYAYVHWYVCGESGLDQVMHAMRQGPMYVVQRVDTRLDYRENGGRSCMYKWVVSG